MKKVVFAFVLLFSFSLQAQVRKVQLQMKPAFIAPKELDFPKEDLDYAFEKIRLQRQRWYSFNSFGLNMSEAAYSNWNAGIFPCRCEAPSPLCCRKILLG